MHTVKYVCIYYYSYKNGCVHALMACNENVSPIAKIGPPGLILAAKSGL